MQAQAPSHRSAAAPLALGYALLVAYASSLNGLFNREMIITEVLQAVIGSMAILLAIPLTSLIASAVYTCRRPATTN